MKKFVLVALLAASLPAIHGCAAVVVGGAATGLLMAEDRRKSGVYLEDQEIELRATDRLRGVFGDKAASVSTVSYNHHVLIYGQVQDEASRTKAGEIVKDIPNVARVYNATTISGITSTTSDFNDASITTKVKTRLANSDKVSANHVKVVTEAAVVYLMGLVTREEGETAAQIAASTSGAVKVVKLFEYIN
jgi:osmotically-inducible protein OsmY